MKTISSILLLTAWALLPSNMRAQDVNRLYAGDVTGMMSASVYVPFYLENSNPGITAVQFDLTVPEGVTMATSTYIQTEDTRVANHRVKALRQGSSQTYRFILLSPTNQPLRANRGAIFSVRATISGTAPLEEGATYPLTVSNVVLSDSLGHNVMTAYDDGSLTLSANPDFTVTDVSLTSGSTVSPGDEISLSWTVNNEGSIASLGGWKEQLSLVSTSTGESCTLTAQNYDGVLAAGGSVARTATVAVPRLPGLDGNFKVQVKLVPNSDSGERKEYQNNNTTQSGTTYTMRKLLYLSLPTYTLNETDESRTYSCRLERSGSRTAAQTFTLSKTMGGERVSAPASLTINAKNSVAYFSLTVDGNDVVDDPADTLFTFRVSAQNGYALVENTVKLYDDEHPKLTLSALPDELSEGETLTLKLGITPVQQDLKVSLVCSRPSRFASMPSSVTIPAGSSELTLSLQATDDEEVQDEQYIDFTVTALNYENASATVLLKDNDMPDLQLSISPSTVSEGAGPTAMVGRLTRTTNTNTKLTIKLSTSTDGDLYLPVRTLTMPKGATEVQFQLGVVDDAQKQGDRDVVVVAAVYIASCYCQALGTNGGVASQTIHILDDDGPALTLAAQSSNMLEGSTGNVFTVTRNDSPTAALSVSIDVEDAPSELTWPATVTIPAGQQSTTFTVDLGRNAVEGDSRMLTFTATAADYASGTCWVQATDQTLPDAVLTAFSVQSDLVTAGHEAEVSVTVRNDGYAPLPTKFPLMLYCGSSLAATLYTDAAILPGEEQTLTRSVVLSDKAGTYAIRLTANADRSFTELNYSNNSSAAVSVEVHPLFTATVSTDKAAYNDGESIRITGDVTGLESRNREIEVYAIAGGARQTVSATTDGEGHFETEYLLQGNVAGTMTLGVCVPGEELTTAMATVEVRGMRRSDSRFLTHELEVGETIDGYIDLRNHGNLDLTNITATVAELPANISLTFDALPTLAAGGDARLIFHLTGLAASDNPRQWQTCAVQLRSSEGATLDQTLYFVIYPATAVLKSDVSSIRTTMTKDATRTYPITIWNEGRQETGEIQIDLGEASFLSLATPQRMASLQQGEQATIMLQLTPTADMEPMTVVTGNLFIGCQNGNGLNIGYRLETVSEQTGTLVVDVWDEFTYNTDEAPHVKGATVALKHPVSQQLLHQAVTGSDGLATFADLAEGTYLLSVTHPHHTSMSKSVLVSPGTTQTERVFIPYNAISVSMTYEKTEVEDEYDIVTTVTYETHVPKPVVVIDAPKKIIMAEQQLPYVFYVHLTNVGLVKAPDLTFRMPERDNGYDFTPLVNGPWDLMPQQTLTIPVQVTASATGVDTKRRREGLSAQECGQEMLAGWFDVCKAMNAGTFNVEDYVMHQLQVREACAAGQGGVAGGGGLNPGDGGVPDLFKWIADHFPNFASVSFARPGILPAGCDPWLTEYGPDLIDDMQQLKGFGGGLKKGCAGVAGDGLKGQLGIPNMAPSAKHTGKVPTYEGSGAKPRRVSGRTEWDDGLTDDECRTMWKGWLTAMKETYEAANAELGYFSDPVLTLPGNTEPSSITEEMLENSMLEASPSWWKAYVNRCVVAGYGAYHNMLYSYHALGDVLIDVDDYTELSPLVDAVRVAVEGGKAIEPANFESLKPTWLSDDEFAAVVQRLSDSNFDYTFLDQCLQRVQAAEMQAQRMGYASTTELQAKEAEKVLELLMSDRSSVCSKVRFEINQTMTMTREAVRGTLTVENGSSDTDMRDVKLNLVVTDPDGNVANARIMEIHTESLEGFGGELSYESGWTLAAGNTGTAKIIFIPTKYAAPTEPLQYTFSGSISYIDPFTGLQMTRELEAERLTINPSPELDLTYFMQRDILGDDPLTKDVVEPIIPSQFSLLINNKGFGDATKVKMLTRQPQIVDNEKGLLVNFEIQSSQLNGGDKTLALGGSVVTDFGTIPAHSQTYAQWWLTSTLTGHFLDYDVRATHVTSYDNPDLSLLDQVSIHELIHQIVIPPTYVQYVAMSSQQTQQAAPLIGFMANDEEDTYDEPDQLYLSNASVSPIRPATTARIAKQDDSLYSLTVMPSAQGWTYGNLPDPTGGRRKLKSVTKQNGGITLPLDNFWQTDRTLVDMNEPVYENLIHFADSMQLAGETYLLEFEPRPSVVLAVRELSGLPANNSFTRTQVDTVTVSFNKPIRPESFTTADLTLMHEGEWLTLDDVTIKPVNETTYKVAVKPLTLFDGFYSLTVQTAGIEDTEGFSGEVGKQRSWIQVTDGKARLTMLCEPEGVGQLTPGTSQQDYFGTVAVSAVPAEGYTFLHWKQGDAVVSTEPAFSYEQTGAQTLTAVFQPVTYKLSVDYDDLRGRVEGIGTGRVDYNTPVSLKATPMSGFYFDGWYDGTSCLSQDAELRFTLSGNTTLEARFLQLQPLTLLLDEDADNSSRITAIQSSMTAGSKSTLDLTVQLNRVLSPTQWNTLCLPFALTEQQINKQWGYSTMILELTSAQADGTLNFTYVYEMKAGRAYLVRPERRVLLPEFRFQGTVDVAGEPIASEFDGYQFVGIYSPRPWSDYSTEYYYGVQSNTLIAAKPSTATLKGLRAYFVIPAGSSVKLNLGGIITGIDEVDAAPDPQSQRIYTVQGIYAGTDWNALQPGIYIVNGQKRMKR